MYLPEHTYGNCWSLSSLTPLLPLPFMWPPQVVDRRWLQSLLVAALPGAQLPAGVVARPPAAVVVDSWEGPGGVQVVEAAGRCG